MALILALALVLCIPAVARGDHDVLDPLLRVRAQQLAGRSRVIVEFRDAVDVRVITAAGGIPGRPVGRGRAAEVDNQALLRLAADQRVARVIHDRPAFATLERTGTAIGLDVARAALERGAVRRGQADLTGEGIGVAIIDSGMTAWHDDLHLEDGGEERVAHFRDFTRPSHPRVWSSDAASDDFGHGTHVAGIVAGSGYDSHGRRRGIAPGAHLVGLKVLDAAGVGYISDVIAAIDYAIAIRRRFNIRIITISVGAGVFESYATDPLAQAARRAVDAGIVVVASAGNFGVDADDRPRFGGITAPGNAPWVITVGGASHNGTDARSDDSVARFSSRGPTRVDRAMKPDLVAYGVGIESLSDRASTLYGLYPDYLLDGTRPVGYRPYLSLTGTSMAAPVVAGAVALMLEANPTLTPNAVKAILQYTAEDRPEGPAAEGAGLLNARGAVRLARHYANRRQPLGPEGDWIAGEWVAWGRRVLWGDAIVEGGLLTPGSPAWTGTLAWGASSVDNIVWSTYGDDNIVWSTYDADNIVWSTYGDDNIVWSTHDGDNIVWSTYGDDNIVWSTSAPRPVIWPRH